MNAHQRTDGSLPETVDPSPEYALRIDRLSLRHALERSVGGWGGLLEPSEAPVTADAVLARPERADGVVTCDLGDEDRAAVLTPNRGSRLVRLSRHGIQQRCHVGITVAPKCEGGLDADRVSEIPETGRETPRAM